MGPGLENPRLLIVDDDEDLGRLLERTLVGEGYRVKYATTSKRAMELLGAEVFELVMLDVRMPDENGFEICRRIKSNPATKDTPVMFVTGEERSNELLAQALAAGGCDYLTKPFSRVDVVSRVRCIIHQRIELLRLKQLEMNDSLTGLPGRSYFRVRLDEELAESERFGNSVAVVLADVSDLATVYEQQGQEAGDRWVERFALLLRSECRRYDFVARLEGFLFALMLPRVNAAGGVKAARRMSEIWRLTTLEVGGLDFYVPVTMAVECHSGAATPPSGGDLLSRAVTMLERAKASEAAGGSVVGPSPDPYAASIWSDYLVDTPNPSSP